MTAKYYTTATEFNCGIDLHSKQMYVCIMDRTGKIQKGSLIMVLILSRAAYPHSPRRDISSLLSQAEKSVARRPRLWTHRRHRPRRRTPPPRLLRPPVHPPQLPPPHRPLGPHHPARNPLKTSKSFPRNGKMFHGFSTQWKKCFHTVENCMKPNFSGALFPGPPHVPPGKSALPRKTSRPRG